VVLRRRLLAIAWVVLGLAALHFVDHVIRGYAVLHRGLDPAWNHSGWPFLPEVTPFTASLIGVSAVLGAGIWLTTIGKAWARYWLVTAILLEALVVSVHFLGARAETPTVIYRSWASPLLGILAVANTFAIIAALLVMAINAALTGRASHWTPINGPARGSRTSNEPSR